MSEELRFPEKFLWGSATSSYQVEGGINNNDWAKAAKDGKVPPAGRATDHYNRYEEDFDIAKLLGQNAHRFSVEWARIEPEEGRFDEKEIGHYRQVLGALQDRGLEPFVTLWHFTLPVWFANMGGFENKKAPFYFSRYCEYVVGKVGDLATFFITINEPMVYASKGYRRGSWPPFKKNIFKFMKVAVDNLSMSHNVAYQKIKSVFPSAQIGIAKNQINFESNNNPFNRLLSKFMTWFWNHRFLSRISKCQDFIGANYYYKKFGDKAGYDKSDMGWDIYPKGIYNVLMELKKYQKPIFVTENGVADASDSKRAEFIKDHLYWTYRAIHDGVDLHGYFYWSLLDNFEWDKGYWPRFGLVAVNENTMERHIKQSAYKYKEICETNILK